STRASRRRAGERAPRRSPRRGRPGRSGSGTSDPRRRSRTSSRCAGCAGAGPGRRARAPWRRSSRGSRAGASWGRSPRRTACCTRCRRTSASPAWSPPSAIRSAPASARTPSSPSTISSARRAPSWRGTPPYASATPAASAPSWSTSSRTPTACRPRSCASWRRARPRRSCSWWATRSSRSTAFAAPTGRLVTFVDEHDQRELRAAEARELEARVLAGVVERLHAEDGIRYGDIAVLLRAFTEVKTYENALRRRELPYYVVKGRGFFQCQEVSDVVSLLAAILDPEDGVALAAALRSPLFALDDDTLWRLAWPPDEDRPSLPRRFRAAEGFADLPEQAAALGAVRDLLLALRARASRATI